MARVINRRRFVQSSALAGAALLAGCSGDGGNGDDNSDGSSDDSSGDSGEAPTAALSVPSLSLTFFARMQNAFKQAQSDGMISTDSSFYDAGNSQSTQVSDVENAVSNEVDFLMIGAITEEGVVSAIEEANAADIPVIAIDRNVAQGETVSYIASDNVSLGERSTELCLEHMQEQSDADTYSVVQLEGTPGASVTNERGQGFQNVVDNNDALESLDSQTGEFGTEQALSVMEDFITQHGDDIDGVFCQNDMMALGVYQALQNSDVSAPVTGIDGSEAWVQRFNENQYYGTIAQLPEKMVTTAIETGITHLNGEDVEEEIAIDGLSVTQENSQDYLDRYF